MDNMSKTLALSAIAVTVATLLISTGCSSYSSNSATSALSDGEVTVPTNYRSWPKFVKTVEKDNGQIREIYINKAGMKANKGEAFPYGTKAVMELHKSRKDTNGQLVKDGLTKVFVMEKGKGYGQNLPSGSAPNGEWAYGAYLADAKTAATKDFSGCRTCHVPFSKDDFIIRYDEHFNFKK